MFNLCTNINGTKKGDVGENIGAWETKCAAKLKTLYKGFKDVSGKP